MNAKRQTAVGRLIERVRSSLEGRRDRLPATPARDAARPRPYLEPLEPRVLLSADVGLVPDALLAPPDAGLELQEILEPAIHDDVLVREPSRFEGLAARQLGLAPAPPALDEASADSTLGAPPAQGAGADAPSALGVNAEEVEAAADEAALADPEAAARALRDRIWGAELIEAASAESSEVRQVVVVDARVPEVASLLESLLENTEDLAQTESVFAPMQEGSPEAGDETAATGADSGEEEAGNLSLDSFSARESGNRAGELAEELEARGIAVVVLDVERDGLDQLEEIARAYQGVGAMHVVSHGARGRLRLGRSSVTTETLRSRGESLDALRAALGEGGDLLLYGCEVAAGEVGVEFVSTLAEMTGLDVAASDDVTGAGGDWDLEVLTGAVETASIRADAFAASLLDLEFASAPAAGVDTTVTVGFDTGTSMWTISTAPGSDIVDADEVVAPGDSPTAVTTFALTAGEVLTITGGAGNEDFVLTGLEPGFTGSIEFLGEGGSDSLSIAPITAGSLGTFAGILDFVGGEGSDDLDVTPDSASALAGFAGTIRFRGGLDGDTASVGTDGGDFTGFAGTIDIGGEGGADTFGVEDADLASGVLTISGGSQDDVLNINAGDGGFSGSLTFDGGADVDRVTFEAGTTIASSATIGLAGGTGDDRYVFDGASGDTIGAVTITEAVAGGGDADAIDYGGDANRFGAGSSILITSDGSTSNPDVVEIVESLGFSEAAITELIEGLRSFAEWGGSLDDQGDYGMALAGVRANADLGVGSALDLRDAFERLALAVESKRAAGEVIDTDSLKELFTNLQLRDIERLDRTLLGDVVGAGAVAPGDGFGLTIQLDDGAVFRLGLAADSGVNAADLDFVVRLSQAMVGLSFVREADGDLTVRRDSGNWSLDGFRKDQKITFAGSLKETSSADAADFKIESISGDGRVLTLVDGDAENALFDLFLTTETPAPSSGDPAKLDRTVDTAAATDVQVAKTIFQSATDGVDWKAQGFRVGQTIAVPSSGGSPTELTIASISEDGRVLTVEEALAIDLSGEAETVTGKAITGLTLPALVTAINDAIAPSDLSGRVEALVTDTDAGGAATATSRLGLKSLDSDAREIKIRWTDGPATEIGFLADTEQSRSGLLDDLQGLGTLDAQIGARYFVSTFESETTSGTPPVTLSDTAATPAILESFSSSSDDTLTFAARADGSGTLTRAAAPGGTIGTWDSVAFAAGERITVSGTASNDGTYVVVTRGDTELVLERELVFAGDLTSGTIVRSAGSWTEDGFSDGQRIEVDDGGTISLLTVSSISTDGTILNVAGDVTGLIGPQTVDRIRAVGVVSVDFDPDTGELEIAFDYSAERTSAIGVSVGTYAEEELKLALDGTISVDLVSTMSSTLSIGLDIDGATGSGTPSFDVDLDGLSVVADINTTGSAPNIVNAANNIDAGKSANIGFLGAEVGPAGGHYALRAGLDLTAVSGALENLTDEALDAEVAAESQLADSNRSLARSSEFLSVEIPLAVSAGLPLVGGGAFDASGLAISTSSSSVRENPFDGADALSDAGAFVEFDQVAAFANIDAPKFIRLLGQIRSGLAQLSESDLIAQFGTPFIKDTLGKIVDIADAFGDAVLFDDGDDGLDRDNDEVLVTDLNKALADQGLGDWIEARVIDLPNGSDGQKTFELVAKDDSVTEIEVSAASGFLTDRFFGILSGISIEEDGEIKLSGGGLAAFMPAMGRLTIAEAATIRVTRSSGGPIEKTVTLTPEGTNDNEKLGNDVAKLLDADNAPTFKTAQELATKLIDLVVDAVGNDNLVYDSDNQLLLYSIDLENELFREEFDIDFDLDLGPVGDIQTLGDPKISIGGTIGFNIDFGIDLSPTPNGQSVIDTMTKLTDLSGVDELGDVIKTRPSITARNGIGEPTLVNDPDDDAASTVDVTLDRVRMSGNPGLTFASADVIAVTPENLVGSLASLRVPAGYEIFIRQGGTTSTGNFRQQPLTVPSVTIGSENSDGLTPYTTQQIDFELRIDPAGGPSSEFFSVTVDAAEFLASSQSDFKRQWLGTIRDSIEAAQSEGLANTITRAAGSGSWAADGFAVGQTIQIKGSDSNDGFFEIIAVGDATGPGGDGRLLTVEESLVATPGTPTTREQGIEIEGAGTISVSDAAAIADFGAGDTIQISGSLRNNGNFLVAANDGLGTLTLSRALDPEPTSSEIMLMTDGAPVRLTPPPSVPTPDNDGARMNLEIDGVEYSIVVYAEANEDDVLAPNTADNESRNDLVQDFRTALGRAAEVGAAPDAALVDLSDRVLVALDGTALVFTLAGGELAKDVALTFTSTGTTGGREAGTITRTGADDDDPAGSWEADGFKAGDLIRIDDADEDTNNGLYRIVAIGDSAAAVADPNDDLSGDVLSVVRLDSTTAIAAETNSEDVEIEGETASSVSSDTFEFSAGGTILRSATSPATPGSFLAEGFEIGQLVVIDRAGVDNGTYRVTDVATDGLSITVENLDASSVAFSGATGVTGSVVAESFRISSVNAPAQSLGFGDTDGPGGTQSQNASLHDLVVIAGDGTEYLVTLDGATTVQDVLDRINSTSGTSVAGAEVAPGQIRAQVDEAGSGIELLAAEQLTGNPRLTFSAATPPATAGSIVRSAGDWADDGFVAGEKIDITGTGSNDGRATVVRAESADPVGDPMGPKTVLIVSNEGGGDTLTIANEEFVRDAVIRSENFRAPASAAEREEFRVELINGSVAAIGLGILRGDAEGDINQDGIVDFDDADGVIQGTAIGGASIFDRIFIKDPLIFANLDLDVVDSFPDDATKDGVDILGDFGFFEANLNANGNFFAEASLTLNDPTPDPTGDDLITLRDIVKGIRNIGDFIDTPKFSGNRLDDGAGTVEFRNELVDGTSRGVIIRQDGVWGESADGEDDDFAVSQRITIRNLDGVAVADYTILDIDMVDVGGGTMRSRLVLEQTFTGLSGTVAEEADGDIEVAGAIGTLVLALGEIELGDFASIDAPDDAKVALTLFDFGDPFYKESVGADSKKGGTVSVTGLDRVFVQVGTGAVADINAIREDVKQAAADGRRVKIEVVYVDSQGEEQTVAKDVNAFDQDANGNWFVTLDEDLVDDLGDIRQTNGTQDVLKATFTQPPRTEIETPNLGNLLDFSNISIRDIIRALQQASAFLGQFEEFTFLDQDIPIVGVSFNDLLDFADQLAEGVEEIERDPDGSLQTLEARIEEVLGIDDGVDGSLGQDPFDIELSLVTEELGTYGSILEASTRSVLRIDLILGAGFNESLNVDFEVPGGVFAGSAGIQASGEGEILIALGFDITEVALRESPGLLFEALAPATDEDPAGSITRADGFSWLADGFLPGQTIKVKGTTANDGRHEIHSISGDGSTLFLEKAITSEGAVGAPVSGVEVTGTREISLFEDTAISAGFDAGADDIDFRAAAGPLGVFVNDGMIGVGGTVGPTGEDLFRAGLKVTGQAPGTRPDGTGGTIQTSRRVLSDVLEAGIDAFEIIAGGGLDVDLPVFFPVETQQRGAIRWAGGVEFDAIAGEFTFDVDGIRYALGSGDSLSETDASGDPYGFSDLFDLSGLLDLGQLSIFDNILLAADGIDLFLSGVQDVLDGEVFGIDLPLIGDSLSDGARFIEDLRNDFVEPFRDLVEDAETFVDDQENPDKNLVSQFLFDLLSQTNLLLVTRDADGNLLADDDIRVARKSDLVTDPTATLTGDQFFLRQAIQLDGTRSQGGEFRDSSGDAFTEGEIDIAAIPSAEIQELAFLEWDFRLGQRLAAVDSDIGIDFGLPAIGFEADGALGIQLDWDLELGFGLNFEDGFYFDISSADELEVDIDVLLPDSLTGRLAFLQLNALNVGSGLGASFAVDVVNKKDAGDDRLSFTELGKLKLETGLAAEATALLELELKLNEELLADFANVFPTVMADFEFDWGIGSRGSETLSFGASSGGTGTITRAEGSWTTDGYLAGQTIRISGTEDGRNDGAYEIQQVGVTDLTVILKATQTFGEQSGQADVKIYRDLADLDGGALSDGLRVVQFTDIELDLGSFISDFIAPVLKEIQKVTGPIQPVVDLLTSPIPIISDLGEPVTLLDLARATGVFNPALIEAIADIVTLVNAIPTNVSTLVIPFGEFVIFDRSDPAMSEVDPTDPRSDLSGMNKKAQSANNDTLEQKLQNQEKKKGGKSTKSTDFVRKLSATGGFQFPILTDPTQIFGLLTGEEVVLFGYDMPAFELDFEFTSFFPLYGPLGIGTTISAGAKIDFAFGFDSSGLNRFFESGFENPLLIFDGFYVSDNPEDVTGAGPDLNELELSLGIALSAELNLGVARAGVAGGINATVDFDLFDPNRDGKIRVGEILENIENEFVFGNPIISPLAIFDVSGAVTARAFAFLKVDLLFFSIDAEFDITPTVTLVDFEVDFTRAPKLATELDDGTLQLNMGEFAELRLNDDLKDGDEHFVVKSESGGLRVTWEGSNGSLDRSGNPTGRKPFTNLFKGNFNRILALGGEGDDFIDLAGVSTAGIRFEVDGGSGNDKIVLPAAVTGGTRIRPVGTIRGGEGSDEIVGSGGNDLIIGGEGSDRILGGGGDDVIFGDLERLIEKEARVKNKSLTFATEGSTTTITRNDDGSFFFDGFDEDQILQVVELDPTADARTVVNEALYKIETVGETTLTLVATGPLRPQSSGPIPISGESAITTTDIEVTALESTFLSTYKATASDSDSADAIAGGSGNDWIFGGGGDDALIGGDAAGATNNARLADLMTYLTASEPNLPNADATSDADGNDIVIGDGGEIRLNRDGSIRMTRDTLERDVAATDRGLSFGNDRIFGSGGDDLLFGGRGDDEIRGGAGEDDLYGERGFDELFGDSGMDAIFGGRDGDTIDGGSQVDTIYGEQGADLIRGGSGGDTIYGDAGADTIFGEDGGDTIDGGSDPDLIFGGGGNDVIDGGFGTDSIFGYDATGTYSNALTASIASARMMALDRFEGALDTNSTTDEDRVRVRAGDDFVDGEGGTDRYRADYKGAENSARLRLFDSGVEGDGTDQLVINGTARADQFLLRAGAGSGTLAFVASINRGEDVERLDYDGIENIVVNGQFGDDSFAFDDIRAAMTINGDGGADTFQVGQLYRTRRNGELANIPTEDRFQTTATTRGFLSNGISRPLTLNGGNDNDTFVVYRNVAALQINGQNGDDAIEVRAFALVNPEDRLQDETKISGGGGADTIRYAVNAPVSIDGGDGLDSVAVIGTEFDDDFVITDQGVFGAGLNITFVNIELLKVDGAEGNDSFFIQSTNEDILTQVLGGLGSDTFQVADGLAHDVISNDLRGHSGLIIHDVDSEDPVFAGPEGDGIRANGISANIGDADEPGIVITPSNGFTRIAEGGVIDWYTVVLTRAPIAGERVIVTALAPSLSPEQEEREELLFAVYSPEINSEDPDYVQPDNATTGLSTALTFTANNWDEPQTVYVLGDSGPFRDASGRLIRPTFSDGDVPINYDDNAPEGERFGVIQHIVQSSGTSQAGSVASIINPGVFEDGKAVTIIELNEDLLADGENLEGRLFEVTDNPLDPTAPPPVGNDLAVRLDVGGKGQSLLIKSAENNLAGRTVLTVFGLFDADDALAVDSEYAVRFYDNLQTPNVAVQMDDNDAADVILLETEDLRVFERSATDAGDPGGVVTYVGYDVVLGREPENRSGGGSSTVEVRLTVTSPDGGPDQELRLTTDEPDPVGGLAGVESTLTLTFTSGGDGDGEGEDETGNAWNIPQRVWVAAVDDTAREGVHRGLITHEVVSSTDSNEIDVVVDESIMPEDGVTSFVLLDRLPAEFRGDVQSVPSPLEIQGFDDSGIRMADLKVALEDNPNIPMLIRITRGPGAGETRTVTAISSDGVVTIDSVWDTVPDVTSQFSISQVSVSLVESGVTSDPLARERFVVNGSTVIFFDETGALEERNADEVLVTYAVLDEGFDGRTEERLSVQVIDNDTATVLVLESDFSTDVIEGNAGADDYSVVLSRPPTEDVFVRVDAPETVTSRGDLIRGNELPNGDVEATNLQLVVASAAPGATRDGASVILRFTPDNWNVPQVVSVTALTDGLVDGGDTKAFAPRVRTLVDLQGPLLVDGAGGSGSRDGLAPPVLLPGELNRSPKDGDVLSATTNSITVDTDALVEAQVGLDANSTDEEIRDYLLGRTAEIVSGPAVDEFNLISNVVVDGETTRIEFIEAWRVFPDAPEEDPDDADNPMPLPGYRITRQSANFFVRESDQQDILFVHDEDSPADSQGVMTTLDYAAFPTMESVINGALGPDDPGYVTPRRLTGFGMGPDTTIARGLRPGGITYSNFEGFELDLGYNDNTLTIDAINESEENKTLFTRIRTGRGNDTVLIDVDETTDPADVRDGTPGLDWLLVDTGRGDDVIDAAESTLVLQLIGGLGNDTITGGQGNDLIYGDLGTLDFFVDPNDSSIEPDERRITRLDSVESTDPSQGGNDVIDGQAGNDRIFGGAGDDDIRGAAGMDIVFGDHGRVTGGTGGMGEARLVETTVPFLGGSDVLSGGAGNDAIFGGAGGDQLRGGSDEDILFGDHGRVDTAPGRADIIETIDNFVGAGDFIDGGLGNDFIFGGAGGDALVGNFSEDLVIGEYARLRVRDGVARSIVRLGQGDLDVAAAAFFALYDPRFDPIAAIFGPAAAQGSQFTPRPVLELTESLERDPTGGRDSGSEASHEVTTGDSLWDLAEERLGNPYRWTEIFDLNEGSITDPDLIRPGQEIDLPTDARRTGEQPTAPSEDLAALRDMLQRLDSQSAAETQAGWGFSNPLAVGAGPPGAQPAAEPPSGDSTPSGTDGAEVPEPQDGAQLEVRETDLEMSSAIWTALVGWRASSTQRAAGRWMRFDRHAGRFS